MANEPKSSVVAIRLPADLRTKLEARVQRMNDQAYDEGRAPVYTLSAMLSTWIAEREEVEQKVTPTPKVTTHEQVVSDASHVLAALEKLRGASK